MFILGPWSPNGQYLPILAFTGPASVNSYVNLYLYDSEKLTAKKIYSSSVNEKNGVWASSSFNYSSIWLDDYRLAIERDRDLETGTMDLTYITIDGEMQTIQQSNRPKKVSSQLEYVLAVSESYNNSYNPKIESIKVGSQTLDFVPEGEIVGVVEGMLAVFEKPEFFDIASIVNDNSLNQKYQEYFEKELKKLEEQGLSEDELKNKALDLFEPKGETILKLYNLKNGSVESEINLTDGTWQTQSVLVHPSEKFLVAHQTDKFFNPLKQRFITITPPSNIKIVFEEDLSENERAGNSNYLSLFLFQGTSFFLSSDGNWIIGMRGPGVNDPQNSKIYMRNIVTGEENIICPSYCWDMRTYFPLYPRTLY